MEHTEGGIIRTTTVTNQQGTMTSSTIVNRDDDAGTKTVTTMNSGFDGEARGVENTVTRTEDGTGHRQAKSGDDHEDEVSAALDRASPPES